MNRESKSESVSSVAGGATWDVRLRARPSPWRGLVMSLALSVALGGCQVGGAVARTAARATAAEATAGADQGTLEAILSVFLGGIQQLLQPQRDFWLGLAATIDQLELTDQALRYGIPTAVLMICATDGPADLTSEGARFEIDPQSGAEVFVASGGLGARELPVEVSIDPDVLGARVVLRGGGWLLCGLSEGDVEVDDEPLDLGDPDGLEAQLSVHVWPEPSGDVEQDAVPPTAVEVRLSLRLDLDVLRPIVEAEHLTIWLADEPVEIVLDGDPAVERLRAVLARLAGDVAPADDEGIEGAGTTARPEPEGGGTEETTERTDETTERADETIERGGARDEELSGDALVDEELDRSLGR